MNSLNLKTLICLHARSSDLSFLSPVRKRIEKIVGSQCKVLELTNQSSHAEAKLALRQAANGVVIIFAHGSGDYLRGGEYRSSMSGENIEIEKFITRKDISAFNGKVVFCMSCGSNGLAKASLDSGAVAFVGFDDIPFDRFNSEGKPIGKHVLVKHCQCLIVKVIQATLERFLLGRASLDECIDYLQLLIAKEAVAYVRKMKPKGVKERKEVAALFLKIKAGVRYHGQCGVFFTKNND